MPDLLNSPSAFARSEAIQSTPDLVLPGLGHRTFPILKLAISLCILRPAPCTLTQQPALSLAAKVDRHYNALHALRVDFVQQYDGLGQHRRESGVLLLKKSGRMRWTYTQPPGKLFVLDGRNGYFYSPGQSEVQRIPAKKLDDLQSPLRFLLGHAALDKELRHLQITAEGENFEISGEPKNMERRVDSIHLRVRADGTILRIKVEEVDGSLSTFTFSGEILNPPTSDSDFVFQAPKGIAVVDGLPPA